MFQKPSPAWMGDQCTARRASCHHSAHLSGARDSALQRANACASRHHPARPGGATDSALRKVCQITPMRGKIISIRSRILEEVDRIYRINRTRTRDRSCDQSLQPQRGDRIAAQAVWFAGLARKPLALGRVLDLSAFIHVHLRFALCGPVNGYDDLYGAVNFREYHGSRIKTSLRRHWAGCPRWGVAGKLSFAVTNQFLLSDPLQPTFSPPHQNGPGVIRPANRITANRPPGQRANLHAVAGRCGNASLHYLLRNNKSHLTCSTRIHGVTFHKHGSGHRYFLLLDHCASLM